MAECTSGKNLTVLVLDEAEAEALGHLLHEWYEQDKVVNAYTYPLESIREALT